MDNELSNTIGTLMSSWYSTLFFLFLLLLFATGEKQARPVSENRRPLNKGGQMESPESCPCAASNTSKHSSVGEFHNKRTHYHGSTKEDDELFNNSKHEVPSGPNPISNR
ncbi:hypothetical protein DsansV1_C13g0125291 [Dioscorea sansibarensis]